MGLWNKRLPMTLSVGLVAGGLLLPTGQLATQAQAADQLQTATTALTAQVAATESVADEEIDGFDPVAVAAPLLGMETDALYTELEAGKSIAQVAQEQDVAIETIIDALVAADEQWIDQLVTEGAITAEEAAEWKEESVQYATDFVNEDWSDVALDEGMDPVAVAAPLLGLDTDALYTELEAGKSIANLAQEKGVAVQTIIDAIVAADAEWIDGLVTEGEITAEEAAEWKAESVQYATDFVNDDWSDIALDEGMDPVAVAAPLLGMETDALYTELEAGKSIANLAQEKGVAVQTIIDAIVAADAEWIDELVAEGEITVEEAAEWKQESVDFATDFVNNDWTDVALDDGMDPVAVVAPLLGMETDALYTELEAGKSIANLAQEKGVAVQTIIDALVAADAEWIDQLLAEGAITAEEATEWKAESVPFATDFVNNDWTEDDNE